MLFIVYVFFFGFLLWLYRYHFWFFLSIFLYWLVFDSYFTGAYGQTAHVEVSTDGGTTWASALDLADGSAWETITVNLGAYTGAGMTGVIVAFHTNDNGAWASGWAIDNVVLVPNLIEGSGNGIVLFSHDIAHDSFNLCWCYVFRHSINLVCVL